MYLDLSENKPKIKLEDPQTGEIPDQPILITASIGAGKSNLTEAIGIYAYDHQYKVIVLWDPKNKLESAFTMFAPTNKQHIRQLKKFGVPERTFPTEIYHPFTFDLPNRKLPKMNLYTKRIKALKREELSFISETYSDTETIKIMIDTLKDLAEDEGLPQLIYLAENKTEGQEQYKGRQLRSLDPDTFFTKGASSGTQKTIKTAIELFKPFKTDYILAPDNCKLNLDMGKIINDHKTITVFSAKYLKDSKMRHFAAETILHELDTALDQGLAKHPICLMIPEINKLCPKKLEGYQIFMANDIKELLTLVRNKGKGVMEVMDGQVYFDINADVRKMGKEVIFGQISSLDEIEDIAKALSLRRDEKLILTQLKIGEFVSKIITPTGTTSFSEPWRPFRPGHMHADKGKTFEEEYERQYPDQLCSYEEETKYITQVRDTLIDKARSQAIAYNQQIINAVKNKEKERQERSDEKMKQHTEKILNKSRKQTESDLAIARVWSKMKSEGKSLQQIADEYKTYKERVRRMIARVEAIDGKTMPESTPVTETE